MINRKSLVGVAGCLLLAACDSTQPQPSPSATSDVLSQASPQDTKKIAGSGKVGDAPSSINLPAFQDEKLLIDERNAGAFAKAGMQAFPEITKVRFHPDDSLKGDPEATQSFRDSFYAGLYYAEMTKIGNGSSLFDLMTKCGRLTDPASGAMLAPPTGIDQKDWMVAIQYFPKFKRAEDDETVDLQILLDRQGDKLTARSAWFSSHVLDGSTFMADHGIRCM